MIVISWGSGVLNRYMTMHLMANIPRLFSDSGTILCYLPGLICTILYGVKIVFKSFIMSQKLKKGMYQYKSLDKS